MNNKTAALKLTTSMVIFGTIGIFRNYISCSSPLLAFVRGSIGMLFLLAVILLKKQKIKWDILKKKLPALCISGALIGFNWILLFEAYRYTTVATATLCYYMAPVFVILASPFILREKLTAKKIICTLLAICGMVIISGIFGNAGSSATGIILGLGAAALYASVILLNKFINGVSDYERTLIQLGSAALAILPYILLTEDLSEFTLTPFLVIMLLIVGILHTGIAYTIYFGGLVGIEAQSAAILSYIDPVIALILSALLLKEPFGIVNLLGSVLILGSALVSELPADTLKKFKKKEKNS